MVPKAGEAALFAAGPPCAELPISKQEVGVGTAQLRIQSAEPCLDLLIQCPVVVLGICILNRALVITFTNILELPRCLVPNRNKVEGKGPGMFPTPPLRPSARGDEQPLQAPWPICCK